MTEKLYCANKSVGPTTTQALLNPTDGGHICSPVVLMIPREIDTFNPGESYTLREIVDLIDAIPDPEAPPADNPPEDDSTGDDPPADPPSEA